ncbi:MAG: hypothetical protein ACMUIA_11250 [bacterium]
MPTDKHGEQALIKHILGECIVHPEPYETHFVMANDMLAASRDYLAIHKGYGGTKNIARTGLSLDRYVVTNISQFMKARDIDIVAANEGILKCYPD